MVNIIKKIVSLWCISFAMGLYAADTPQMVKVIPWAYNKKRKDKPFFLLCTQVGDNGQELRAFSIQLSDGNSPCEISKKVFNLHKSATSFIVDSDVVIFPQVVYSKPMRVELTGILNTWINAKRLYEMVNKGKKAFFRDGIRYQVSDNLFEWLKIFKLYFE